MSSSAHMRNSAAQQASIAYQMVVTLRQGFNLRLDQIAVIMMMPVRSVEGLLERAYMPVSAVKPRSSNLSLTLFNRRDRK